MLCCSDALHARRARRSCAGRTTWRCPCRCDLTMTLLAHETHAHTHTHTHTCIYTYTYTHTTHAHTHILRNIHPTDGSIYFFISFAPREKISSSVVKFCSVVVLCRLALSSLHSSTSPLFSFLVCCSFFFLLFCTCISLIY